VGFDHMKIVIVLPAYNAEKTLKQTLDEIPENFRDHILLVDDASTDNTVALARQLGLQYYQHPVNKGYGGNQKTCYQIALAENADIVVMLHPDHQYNARVVPDLVYPILRGDADAVFGSRMLGGRPLESGMPWWKYGANIFLTAFANLAFGRYLSEIHSGFRAYSRKYMDTVRFDENSDDFIFDTEIIAQGMACNLFFREVAIETRYFPEASSINFPRSIKYGFGVLFTLIRYVLHKRGILVTSQFLPSGDRLQPRVIPKEA
jgi:glycosyltransferase involved in cell wall biosynthesis